MLFVGGSFAFALGSFPAVSQNADPAVVGATFFFGSLLFTCAGFSIWLDILNPDAEAGVSTRYWARSTGISGWWPALIQLAGMLLFNLSTFDALLDGLSAEQENRLIWAPDLFGSVAFLVASHIAWREMRVERRTNPVDIARWIAVLNYSGSFFFGLSALGAVVIPTTDEILNTTLVNTGTLVGALFFLVGAYLSIPVPSDGANDRNECRPRQRA